MTVKFGTERVGKYQVLSLHGDMLGSVGNSVVISRSVSDLVGKGDKHIIFDVSSLSSPSSDLVNIIASTYSRVKKEGGSVGIVYDPRCSTDIFLLCDVYTYARHYLTLDSLKNEARRKW